MAQLKEKLAILPELPGCYLMKNKYDEIIYVGKAKVLKNRIRSYFTGSHDAKTQRLVSEIADFEYIITSSDVEALVLEMNLIKQHDPKYNVMLKDDKSYPYIKITNEKHPRLITTRRVKKDGGKYFGPYPNVGAANETKRLLDRLYPLRKCQTLPDRVCLYYHIHQCLAPCVYDVPQEKNDEMVDEIARFLKSGHEQMKAELEKKMFEASEQLNFERAIELRDLMGQIEAITAKQKVVMQDRLDRDLFAYAYDKGWMCVQVFFLRQGKLIERDVSIFPIYEEAHEAFLSFISQFYLQKNYLKPTEILLPQEVDRKTISELLEVRCLQPKQGQKKALLQLAKKNAEVALQEKFALIERNEERTIKAVENLGAILQIPAPYRIEAFDNSNIQGTDPVSAMVTFIDGKPSKKDYRKYKIQTVDGPDDYASMREVIRRRYVRLLKEGRRLPDLIMIDGGKGQIAAAQSVLEDELNLSIPVCGLAKDEKHRTSQLLFGDPPEPVQLNRDSNEFYLLQRIQDEVHRFAITFHRQSRQKTMFSSVLDEIEGIGTKRKQALLKHFGSLKKISEASVEQLHEIGIPKKVASDLLTHLSKKHRD